MSDIELEYEALLGRLRSAGMQPLSELHGGLCGIMAAGGRGRAREWLARQMTAAEFPPDDPGELAAVLDRFADATWQSLSGHALEFEPLLPGDSMDLAERVAALAGWCEGFLGGLALGGWKPSDTNREGGDDVAEVVGDLVEISKAALSTEEREDIERSEFLFVELSEFVRVSAQVVFDTLAAGGDEEPAATIH